MPSHIKVCGDPTFAPSGPRDPLIFKPNSVFADLYKQGNLLDVRESACNVAVNPHAQSAVRPSRPTSGLVVNGPLHKL